jgi:hypothetical protein
MIDYIEDFISKEDQDYIEDYVKDPKFPYRFHKIHLYSNATVSNLQLTHHLYMHDEDKVSPHFPIINPIYKKLLEMYGNINLMRAKINCTMPEPTMKPYEAQPRHVDLKYDNGEPFPHLVCLYYINDSDGPTYFYTNQENASHRIIPKKGAALIFDGSILHAGSNPVQFPYRFALNINFTQG